MDKLKILETLARDLVAAAGMPIAVSTTNDHEVTIGDYLLWPSREEYGESEMYEVRTIARSTFRPGCAATVPLSSWTANPLVPCTPCCSGPGAGRLPAPNAQDVGPMGKGLEVRWRLRM